MPIYEYACDRGCTAEEIRSYGDRDRRKPRCMAHGQIMKRRPSLSHVEPDGVHSYAPNIGDPDRFERQQDAIKHRKGVIDRE